MKRIGLYLLASFVILTVNAQNVPDMLENAIGAVVTVGVHKTDVVKRQLGFRGESAPDMAYEEALNLAEVASSGSGFIIEKNGKPYVITNAHVIESASDEPGSIYVYSVNRTQYEVKIVGGDSFYDIAVLEFIDKPGSEISTIKFRTTEARIGEKVYAIGNPLGEYPYTVTDGIISAKNRMRGGMTGKFGFLQTTATLIWGNSGGPLVDEQGRVVGVNSQIAFADTPDGGQVLQSQINFALEAEISERLVDDILAYDGRVRRAYLGIELSQTYEYSYDGYDYTLISEDELPVISGVIPGSPAYAALADKAGYQVKEINGTEVRNVEEALGELEKVKPGSTVKMILDYYGAESVVSINTTELKTMELENIAKYILNQNTDIEVDYNHPQVAFNMKESNNYYYHEENTNEIKKFEMSRGGGSGAQFFILAAGIKTDDGESMWLVEDLKDMGAALRLTGLTGVIDFYTYPGGGTMDDIELLRQYLSGDENITKSTIWY